MKPSIKKINEADLPLQLAQVFLRRLVGVALHDQVDLAHAEELEQPVLVAEVPQLEHGRQVVSAHDHLLVVFGLFFGLLKDLLDAVSDHVFAEIRLAVVLVEHPVFGLDLGKLGLEFGAFVGF